MPLACYDFRYKNKLIFETKTRKESLSLRKLAIVLKCAHIPTSIDRGNYQYTMIGSSTQHTHTLASQTNYRQDVSRGIDYVSAILLVNHAGVTEQNRSSSREEQEHGYKPQRAGVTSFFLNDLYFFLIIKLYKDYGGKDSSNKMK